MSQQNGQRPEQGWKKEAARLAKENALVNKRVTDLEEELDELRELVLNGNGRDERIERVLDHACRTSRGEEAILTYKEVMAAAEVSAPTAYSYMEQMVSDLDSVKRNDREDGLKRIVVDVGSLNPPKTE